MSTKLMPFVAILASTAAATLFFFESQPHAERNADQAAQTAGDDARRGHFQTLNAAQVGKDEARRLYDDIRTSMKEGYAMSGDPVAAGYQDWDRYNDAPYLSETHGSRYINNYANELAAGYGDGPDAAPLPPGAIVAKDAFAITEDGDLYAQSLFIMEKLEPGANPPTADWRYVMITPKGEIYGDTRGENPDKVSFCHGCHKAAEQTDHLYHVPEAYRIER